MDKLIYVNICLKQTNRLIFFFSPEILTISASGYTLHLDVLLHNSYLKKMKVDL